MLPQRRNLRSIWWLIAFMLSPWAPYIALFRSGAMNLFPTIGFVLFSGALTLLFCHAMSLAEGKRELQTWVLLCFLASQAGIGVHQYVVGQRLRLWPRSGLKVWRRMGHLMLVMSILLLLSAYLQLCYPGLFKEP